MLAAARVVESRALKQDPAELLARFVRVYDTLKLQYCFDNEVIRQGSGHNNRVCSRGVPPYWMRDSVEYRDQTCRLQNS